MNGDVIPTFEAHEARIETVLSDNGREFCGRPDQHPYELFLQLEHLTTRVKRPQSNGIVERFHRTLLEHFRVEGCRTWFETIDEMQTVLDDFLVGDNQRRPHQGRNMNGRTPAKRSSTAHPNEPEGGQKASQKSRMTPPAQSRTVSRLPSLYTAKRWISAETRPCPSRAVSESGHRQRLSRCSVDQPAALGR